MKAAVCRKYGAPEVIELREVAKPHPKKDELLIRIKSTAVNSGDVRVRALAVEGFLKIVMRIVLGFSKPRKAILGTVYAGIVEETGEHISHFKKGDLVFGMTGFAFGAHAEFLVAKETDNLALMPKNATFDEAASLIFGGQTALYFLEKVQIKQRKSQNILIIGATGAVGTAAIQIARHYGAEVTAVCSTEGKSLLESLGFTSLLLYDKEDITTHHASYDVIFDAVGKTTKKQCRNLLSPGGIYKTVGGLEVASESRQQLEDLKSLFENGHLKPVIDRTYTFDQIAEAHAYVDTGRKKGNVVISVA